MSAANSAPRSQWPLNSGMVAVAAALGLSGAIVFWLYRSRNRCDSNVSRILCEAEHKKERGIEAFRQNKFEEAIRFFDAAIEDLRMVRESFGDQREKAKMDELLSSCENNNAASYDSLGNIEECLLHCDLALQIKPDYVKAMARRAKCYFKLGQNTKAFNDYVELICMESINQDKITVYQVELDRVADAAIFPLHNEIVQNRIGKPMKIPQMMVIEWMHATVTSDPLLERMSTLANGTRGDQIWRTSPLDEALHALTLGKYDEIAALALSIIDNDANELVDRMLAVLLAARFLSYQTLKGQAKETAQRFEHFWDELDEAQKMGLRDVHVAYIALQLTLTDLVENESSNSEENPSLDEVAKQRCNQLVEEALRINPTNPDPLVTFGAQLLHVDQHQEALAVLQRATKIDQKNPFIRYYEIHSRLSLGIRQQSFVDIQQQMFLLQQILTESDGVPIFAFINLSKFAMLLQNSQMAFEACKKALEKMPNCVYAIYLLGLLKVPNRGDLADYMHNLERAMRSAIEADPNYWEPYRILAKICAEKKSAAEAADFFSKAISLARKRDELMTLLKEQLITDTFMKRKEQGKNLPRGVMLK